MLASLRMQAARVLVGMVLFGAIVAIAAGALHAGAAPAAGAATPMPTPTLQKFSVKNNGEATYVVTFFFPKQFIGEMLFPDEATVVSYPPTCIALFPGLIVKLTTPTSGAKYWLEIRWRNNETGASESCFAQDETIVVGVRYETVLGLPGVLFGNSPPQPTYTPSPPAVGGIAELPEVADTPLETDDSSGSSAGLIASVAATAAAFFALALWSMRRRLVK